MDLELSALEIFVKNYFTLLRFKLHATPRSVFEFAVIAAAVFLAEPTLRSLSVGAVVTLLGAALRVWAGGYRRQRQELFIAGPYRFVRHPRYLGSFLILLGVVIASRSFPVTAVLLLGVTLIYRRSFHSEEALLLRASGPDFVNYRTQVSAFIPQMVPVAAGIDPAPMFSLKYAVFQRKRREIDTLAGLVLCFGLLYFSMVIPAKALFDGVVAAMILLFLVFRIIYYRSRPV